MTKSDIIKTHAEQAGMPLIDLKMTMDEVASEPTLVGRVLDITYEERGITRLAGHSILVARHNKTNVGIYVVDGDFSREKYKAAVLEAKTAGLRSNRMYVYGRTATYSGPSICFCKFDEIGIAD